MFGARYYGSTVGRFMTPDWAEDPDAVPYADLEDPQTLNLYSYVRNRPETKVDRHFTTATACPCGCGASSCIRDQDVDRAWKNFVAIIGSVGVIHQVYSAH